MFWFENEAHRRVLTGCYSTKTDIKDCTVIIYCMNFFDQQVNNNILKDIKTPDKLLLVNEILHNWLLIKLYLLQRKPKDDRNRFK